MVSVHRSVYSSYPPRHICLHHMQRVVHATAFCAVAGDEGGLRVETRLLMRRAPVRVDAAAATSCGRGVWGVRRMRMHTI
jgi:hypothetical protein